MIAVFLPLFSAIFKVQNNPFVFVVIVAMSLFLYLKKPLKIWNKINDIINSQLKRKNETTPYPEDYILN